MSYTVYDELGRITEAGQVNGISRLPSSSTYSYFISDEGRLVKATRVLVSNPFGVSTYVDNEVLVEASKFYLKTGDFVDLKITDATEFDLYAEPIQ